MGTTSIEWTRGDDGLLGKTWNPIRGCSPVSPGCKNCYAELIAARFSGPGQHFEGFATWRLKPGRGQGDEQRRIHPADVTLWEPGDREPSWTGKMAVLTNKLTEPLRWRSPSRVFVNSMSDLFHEGLTFEEIATVFSVMAVGRHTYQILTKRIERAVEFFDWMEKNDPIAQMSNLYGLHVSHQRDPKEVYDNDERMKSDEDLEAIFDSEWPLENVWLGASVENQKFLDQRAPELLKCPAAKRFISYEPALGPAKFDPFLWIWECKVCGNRPDNYGHVAHGRGCYQVSENGGGETFEEPFRRIDWIIVGGESGPDARAFDIGWARETVAACKAAGVPVFVKQLGKISHGAGLYHEHPEAWLHEGMSVSTGCTYLHLKNSKGGDPAEWPEDLRVREFPS
jgi:protein gp37